MFSVFFFILAAAAACIHASVSKGWKGPNAAELFLRYISLFSLGLMGLFAAYGHIFMGPQIAKMIGWAPGSPFQFEIGIANFSYAVLGILAYWIRGRFLEASLLGWSVLLLGCFAGHIIDYYKSGNDAPYNIGIFIWFNDLALPILSLTLLYYWRRALMHSSPPSR